MEVEKRRKVGVKDGGQQKRPLTPCGLSFANLLKYSRKHKAGSYRGCYLLFCLEEDRFVSSCGLDSCVFLLLSMGN